MKLLVVTSEPITAQQLRDSLPEDLGPDDAEVMVVAPALQTTPLKFWLSDADEAITRARDVSRQMCFSSATIAITTTTVLSPRA